MSARVPTPEAVGSITSTKEDVTASSPTPIPSPTPSPSPPDVTESISPKEPKEGATQFEWPIESNEEEPREVEEVEPEEVLQDEVLLEAEPEIKQNGEQDPHQPVEDRKEAEIEEEEDKTSSAASTPGGKRPVNVVIPLPLLEPRSTPPPPNSPEKKSPTNSLTQSSSKFVHIPEYLGLVSCMK